MKTGDLVKSIKPYGDLAGQLGVIIDIAEIPGNRENKVFKVLWSTNAIVSIWDYDLEVISESR